MPLLTDREVDDELAADWKEISKKHGAPDEGETPPAGDGEGDAEVEVEADAEKPRDGKRPEKAEAADKGETDAPTRDKKTGRYKPVAKAKPGEEAPAAARAEKPKADTQPTERAGQQPAVAQPPQRDLTRAPSTWSPRERSAWANVPAEARAAIHRREADFLQGQSQLLPDAQFGAEMRSTIEPYRMLIDSEGGTPAAAVLDLLKTAAILRTGAEQDKYRTIANIANRFGINLRLFSGQPAQPGAQPQSLAPGQHFRDPRVDQLLAAQQTEQQQRFAQEHRAAEQTVTQWMNEADAAGQPRRPYAADVIDAMASMIPQIKQANPGLAYAQILDAAYEAATWANPEIRQLLQQQQQTATDATRRAENQRRAQDARRGASVNVPRRGGTPRRQPPGTMEDTIAETARELGLIRT